MLELCSVLNISHVLMWTSNPTRGLPLNLLLLTHLLEAFAQKVLQQRTDGFRQGRVRVLQTGGAGSAAAAAEGVSRCSAQLPRLATDLQ